MVQSRDVTVLRGNDKIERQAAFLAAVALWGNWTHAADAADVSVRQAHRWMVDPAFHVRALAARREAADRLMVEIRAEFDRDRSKHLRIGIDMLDRMGSADWARRHNVELSGPEGGPIAIAPAEEVRARTIVELERIRALPALPANGTDPNGELRMLIELTGPVSELSDKELNRFIGQTGILMEKCSPSDAVLWGSLTLVLDHFRRCGGANGAPHA